MIWDMFKEEKKNPDLDNYEIFDIQNVIDNYTKITEEDVWDALEGNYTDGRNAIKKLLLEYKHLFNDIRVPFHKSAYTFQLGPMPKTGGYSSNVILVEEHVVERKRLLFFDNNFKRLNVSIWHKPDCLSGFTTTFHLTDSSWFVFDHDGTLSTEDYRSALIAYGMHKNSSPEITNMLDQYFPVTQYQSTLSAEKSKEFNRLIENRFLFEHAIIFRLLFTLQLLSCTNVKQQVISTSQAINNKRISKRLTPISSYRIIKIPGIYGRRRGESLNQYSVRLHKCRGHFKTYDNLFGKGIRGRFWWSPQIRGNKKLGEIKHIYKVGMPSKDNSINEK